MPRTEFRVFVTVADVLFQELGHQLPCHALAFGDKSLLTVVAKLFRKWAFTAHAACIGTFFYCCGYSAIPGNGDHQLRCHMLNFERTPRELVCDLDSVVVIGLQFQHR